MSPFCFVTAILIPPAPRSAYVRLRFQCHVLIDLKIGKLTHGDVGQMDSYIRMFDALGSVRRYREAKTCWASFKTEYLTIASFFWEHRMMPMVGLSSSFLYSASNKNYPALRESDLEQALLDKLQEFLLELGRGFCFVAQFLQHRFPVTGPRISVLLVFYDNAPNLPISLHHRICSRNDD